MITDKELTKILLEFSDVPEDNNNLSDRKREGLVGMRIQVGFEILHESYQ